MLRRSRMISRIRVVLVVKQLIQMVTVFPMRLIPIVTAMASRTSAKASRRYVTTLKTTMPILSPIRQYPVLRLH